MNGMTAAPDFRAQQAELIHTLARRFALLLGMLASGGLFIFPRIPILIAIAALCFFLKGRSLGLHRAMGFIAMLLVVVFAVTMLGGGFQLETMATRYANFVAGVLLLGLYLDQPRSVFFGDMYFQGKVFAVQAILTVILAEVANGLFGTISIRDTDYRTIGLLFTYHVMLEDSTAFFRPDGFFFEPGVFQIYISLFIYMALFIFRNLRWAAVGVLAALAIQSTTGYIIAVLILGTWFLGYFMKAAPRFRLLALLLVPLIAAPLLVAVSRNLDTKFSGDLRGSAWARQYDSVTGLRIVAQYPLTGIGFDYDRYYEEAAKYGYLESELSDDIITERPNTNGIVTLFYSVGIPLALVFLFGMFRQAMFPHRWLVAAILFLSLFAEALLFTPFFLMIVFSGLLKWRRTSVAPAAGPARRLSVARPA